MRLGEAVSEVLDRAPDSFEDVRRNIDAEWVLQALEATGRATVRRRRLPAEQVIWLVIGMALFRNRSIHEVVSKLDLALPGRGPTVAPSSVAEARARLGEDPMAGLFAISADHWAHASARAHAWRGLAVYGVDGLTLRVPDAPANAEHFGYANGVRGGSAYPIVRGAGLMALRSHLLAAVSFGPYDVGELTYAKDLWSAVPDDSLTVVDKLYFSAAVLIPLARDGKNRHWLIRAKKGVRSELVRHLGKGDALVQMKVRPEARQADPSLPVSWQLRAVTYQRKGFQPQTLWTSMLDPEAFPAMELASLYHERWELELGYDEIKTEMLDREEAIRSKSPDAVAQELYGVFLAYNLVRLEMERVAQDAGVPPARISFVAALRLITDEWLWCAVAAPGAIPKHLRNLRTALKTLVLPARRTERSYPRVVKLKTSGYPTKPRPSRQARSPQI